MVKDIDPVRVICGSCGARYTGKLATPRWNATAGAVRGLRLNLVWVICLSPDPPPLTVGNDLDQRHTRAPTRCRRKRPQRDL